MPHLPVPVEVEVEGSDGDSSPCTPDTPPTPQHHSTHTPFTTPRGREGEAMIHTLVSLLHQQSARAPMISMPAPQFKGTREHYHTWAPSYRAWMRTQGMPVPSEHMTPLDKLALADVLLLVVPDKDKDALLAIQNDGWQMWEELRRRYTRVTQAYIETLQRRLEGAQLLNATGARSYCDRIQRTIRELEVAHGEKWSEQRQITAYLHGLGPRFDSVREWAAIAERDELTLARVLRRIEVKADALVAKERRERARAQRSTTASGGTHQAQRAAVVSGRTTTNCYRCGDTGHIARACTYSENVCYQCKEPGHLKRNCTATQQAATAQSTTEEQQTSDEDESVFAVTLRTQPHTKEMMKRHGAWVVDSGASSTMTGERHLFHDELQPFTGRVQVAKEGEQLPIEGIGTIHVPLYTDKGEQRVLAVQSLFVPGLTHNLLATNTVVQQGGRVIFSTAPYIEMDGDVIPCERYGDQTLLVPTELACITQQLLHRRMAHSDRQRCTKLAERLGTSVTARTKAPCEPCTEANLRRAPLPKQSQTVVENVLDYVATDTQGPMKRGIDGAEYILIYVDFASDYVFDYYLTRKSDAAGTIDQFIRDAGGVPKKLRTDGAGDLCEGEAEAQWTRLRVKLDTTARNSPEQNGRAERKLTVITDHIRAMLADAQLPEEFWPFAARTAVTALNMFLTTKLDRDDTPYKRFTGREPDLSRLRAFGCKAWVHDPRAKRAGKLQPRAVPAVFVGYQQGLKGWRFYLPETGAVVNSRDARFLEDIPGGTIIGELPSPDDLHDEDYYDEDYHDEHAGTDEEGADDISTEHAGSKRRSGRRTAPLTDWWIGARALAVQGDAGDVPTSYREAMHSAQRECWQDAIREELANHQMLSTYEFVQREAGMKLLTGGWTFAVKQNQTGDAIRYKARLFVRGCAQPSDTYSVISSPVASLAVMRLMIAQAKRDGWMLAHVDVKAAYLNATLDEEIYMKPVPGMEPPPDTVCKLLKAWPGLKQAGVCWWNELRSWMRSHGLEQAQAEACIFACEDARVSTWVDDLLLAFRDQAAMDRVKQQLGESFRVTLTPLQHYLNIDVIELKGGMLVASQRRYVEQMLLSLGMDTANGCRTPCGTVRLEELTSEDDMQTCDARAYRAVVGQLLWLSGATRPDISYAVHCLTKQYQRPLVKHMRAAKRVIRYLARTRSWGICLSGGGNLVAYVDADWAGDTVTRKSVSGLIVGFARPDGTLAPVTWRTKQQSCVATSSCFAEYAACHDVCREVFYVRQVCVELGWISRDYIVPVYCDNEASVAIANSSSVKKLSRYIDIRYHFARWCVDEKAVVFKWVEGGKNPADVFTKPTGAQVFMRCIERFMVDVEAGEGAGVA